MTPIDEHTLAAFLTGSLPEERRQEVVAYLADNADARELLCMAQQALESGRSPVAEPFIPPATHAASTRSLQQRGRWKAVGTAMLVLLVVAVVTRLGLDRSDALRSAPGETTALSVRISTPDLQFQWTPLSDAYYYRLVVWDPHQATVVARHETREALLAPDDPFLLALRPQLHARHRYSVRVDAIDDQNRLIQSSELIPFILTE